MTVGGIVVVMGLVSFGLGVALGVALPFWSHAYRFRLRSALREIEQAEYARRLQEHKARR